MLTDIKLIFFGLFDYLQSFSFLTLTFFKKLPFFYWVESSNTVGFFNFSKSGIRDNFIITNFENYFNFLKIKQNFFFYFIFI
jgi:hypothetical protein